MKKRQWLTEQEITELRYWLSWKRLLPIAALTLVPYLLYRLGWL